MFIFLAAIRDEFAPFANVSIQTTDVAFTTRMDMSRSLVRRTRIITVIRQNEKKATCDFYSSNEQKNEVNHSDPLFLAEKASVSKDDRTSNEKGTIVTRLLLRAADDKAASIRSATAYAEDYVKRLYEQSGRQIASIRYRTWPVYPTDDVCQKGQCNVQCRTSKEAFDAD